MWPQRRARGIRGILHSRSRRRRGHGARHQHRRGASGGSRARDGPGDEGEGGERRRGIPAQHDCAKRGRNATLAETAVRESKSFTEREALDDHLIEFVAPDERDLLQQLDGRDDHALRRAER